MTTISIGLHTVQNKNASYRKRIVRPPKQSLLG